MARYQRPIDPRKGDPLAPPTAEKGAVPWLWIGVGFLVTLVSVWMAIWIITLFLSRPPLPAGGAPATIIRLTAPATAEPTPSSQAPTPTPIPTLTPPPPPDRASAPETITAGYFARVFNTDGIGLSVRAGAGTANNILVVAEEGASVLILDGPVEESDFIWWQLQLADGTVGWAVDRFLEPAGEPPDWPDS